MNRNRTAVLVDHYRSDGDGSGFSLRHPIFVHEVDVAVHPSYLIWREVVGAVVIWNEEEAETNQVDW